MPVGEWLFGTPARRDEVYERLLGSNSRVMSMLDREAVAKILVERDGYAAWHLMFLEEWLQQHRF